MIDYPENISKILRELSAIAYHREMDAELEKLNQKFKAWQEKITDTFDLTEYINEFDDDVTKSLKTFYNDPDPGLPVTAAITKGYLKEEEIPEEVLKYIKQP